MSAKHTPGPWTFADQKAGRMFRVKRDHWSIGQLMHPRCGVAIAFGETEANARLIAAAPELLEALKPLAAWADDPLNKPTLQEAERAKAAFARATGAAP